MLARGPHGWAALCRLVSAAHAQAEAAGRRGQPDGRRRPGRATYAADGALVVLLGPDSDVGRLLARRRPDLATRAWQEWRARVPALWCEVVNHRGADPAGRSAPFAGRMLGWAHEQQADVVLTNAVRYARREDAPVADVLDAARRLVPLDLRHIDRRTGEGYLKSSAQMAEVAAEVARLSGVGTERATARRAARRHRAARRSSASSTRSPTSVSARCTFPSSRWSTRRRRLPARPPDAVLRERCDGRVVRALPCPTTGRDAADARERLEHELGIIAGLGYATYFLTVADVVDLIRSMQVRVAARGSGAGSLVTYLLGISGVDPLRHDLLFERFLSPLRQALPDIDIDVESARRTRDLHPHLRAVRRRPRRLRLDGRHLPRPARDP